MATVLLLRRSRKTDRDRTAAVCEFLSLMAARLAAFALAGGFAAAQSGVTPPQIGFLRDGTEQVRPLLGISGNFWMGGPVATGVVSAASSGIASMLKTSSSLQVLNTLGHPVGAAFAATGKALFAFTPAGAPALAWLPDSGALLRWNGRAFEPTPVTAADLNGTVVSLAAPDSSRAAFLVQRGAQLWVADISLSDGGVLFAAELPGTAAPALLFDDGTLLYTGLYTGKSALVLRDPQGDERIIPFTGSAVGFTPMGKDWVLIENARPPSHLGLRLSNAAMFELPEVSQ